MITKEVLIQIADKVTSATGLEVVVTGGAVRDLLHNKDIKDIDMEILGWSDLNTLDVLVEDISALTSGFDTLSVCEVYDDVTLKFVIKTTIDGIMCDILLREHLPKTAKDAVMYYDNSLNKVALVNGKINVFEPMVGNKVVSYKPTSVERALRHAKKYPEYDWTDVLINAMESSNESR